RLSLFHSPPPPQPLLGVPGHRDRHLRGAGRRPRRRDRSRGAPPRRVADGVLTPAESCVCVSGWICGYLWAPTDRQGPIMFRAARLFRSKYGWIVAAVVTVAMLAPLQQARATSAASPVAGYNGLSRAQQANLLSIARATRKFYKLAVDQATNP